MQHIASEQQTIADRLSGIETDIMRLAARMDSISVSYSGLIKKTLQNSGKGVTSEKDKLLRLTKVLGEITALYEKTEKDSQNRSEVEGNKKNIEQIFSDIRKAAECLGMDAASEYSSDPVNLSTGNYVYEKTFLQLHTDLDIRFRIFYNVQFYEKSVLGKGWIHNYECHLKFRGKQVAFVGEDSSEKLFLQTEEGNYESLQKQNGILKRIEEGYLMQDREGVFWYFDRTGLLKKQQSLAGNVNNFTYNEKGNLIGVSDQYNHGLTFVYNENGFLISVADHTGRCVLMHYDKEQLVRITAPESREISYHYDSAHRLSEIVNSVGKVVLKNEYDMYARTTSQTFSDGGVVRYDYLDHLNQVEMTEQNGNQILYEHDDRMRGVKTIDSGGLEYSEFNDQNQRIAYTDRRGNTTHYKYNENGMVSEIETPLHDKFCLEYTPCNQIKGVSVNGKTLYTADYNEKNLQKIMKNPCGGKAQFIYNEKNQLVTCIQEDGSHIGMEYDESGNVSVMVDPMGGRTLYEYDDLRRVIATIDAKGQKTSYKYNDADELIEVCNPEGNSRIYQYDNCGNMISFTDYNGGITQMTYNDVNRITSITDSDGAITQYEYDIMWNLEKEIAPDGGIVQYEYDKLHHMIGITGADGNKETAAYDACGNIIKRTDAFGAQYLIRYDKLNRPIEVEDPEGRITSAKYDALGNVTEVTFADGKCEKTTYDLMGNPLSFTDRNGYCKFYQYDKMGNLVEIADKDSWLTRLEYYPGGLLKKEYNVDGTGWEYQYDANQNVEKLVNQNGFCWNFSYDSLDQLIHVTNNNGFSEEYEYDAVGNVTSVIKSDGTRTTYAYSIGGSLTSMIDANGNKTSYYYDKCHRLTEILQMEDAHMDVHQINDMNRNQKQVRITAYRYDKAGHMVEWIDPEGNQTTYRYDACGRLCARIDAEGNHSFCEYNLDGTEKSYKFSDGKSIQMKYNALRQLIELKDWTGTTSIVPDTMGRPLQITDPNGKSIYYEWSEKGEKKSVLYPDGKKICYEYDQAFRLKSCQLGEDEVRYSYYSNGQLHKRIGPGSLNTSYQYSPEGRISKICHMDGETMLDELSYHYDGNGRKVSMQCMHRGLENNGIYEYCYNAVGSLTTVLKNGVEEEQYQYDSFGNRIWSKVRGVETQYVYNKLDQLTDLVRHGEERHYTYGKNGNLESEWRNGTLFRQLKYSSMDRLVSVEMPKQKIVYGYNGFGLRTSEKLCGCHSHYSEYVYDITKDCQNLMCANKDGLDVNYYWDSGLLGESSKLENKYYFCDPQMTPVRMSNLNHSSFGIAYDSFGCMTGVYGNEKSILGYTGYHMIGADGLAYAYQRDYEPETGRFLSRDPIMGAITIPLALNAYNYCLGDPINRYDPTGAIAAWLASGIVGAVANVAVKAAGDVINSVKNGKVTVSSWQSYVGTAAGGFVSGTAFVASGGNAAVAQAAGSAVETFATNGLNMVSGTDGYTKADGYTWKSLLGDTMKDSADGFIAGATTGILFSNASKVTKYFKIPGITKGTNSMSAVFVTQMKKAAHGYIKTVSGKTLMKGLISMGAMKFFDELVIKGKKALEDGIKGKSKDIFNDLLDTIKRNGQTNSVTNAQKYLTASQVSAECPAAGV